MLDRPIIPRIHLRTAFLLVAGLAAVAPARGDAPPTNRTLLDTCVARVVRDVVVHWPDGLIQLTIDSSRNAPLIAAPMFHATEGRQGPNVTACRARITEAETRYDALPDGRIGRTVAVGVAFELRVPGFDRIGSASEFHESMADTIRCDDIAAVERGEGIPAAHAPDPCFDRPSSLWSTLGPFILGIASATVIVLLFTIRGR